MAHKAFSEHHYSRKPGGAPPPCIVDSCTREPVPAVGMTKTDDLFASSRSAFAKRSILKYCYFRENTVQPTLQRAVENFISIPECQEPIRQNDSLC